MEALAAELGIAEVAALHRLCRRPAAVFRERRCFRAALASGPVSARASRRRARRAARSSDARGRHPRNARRAARRACSSPAGDPEQAGVEAALALAGPHARVATRGARGVTTSSRFRSNASHTSTWRCISERLPSAKSMERRQVNLGCANTPNGRWRDSALGLTNRPACASPRYFRCQTIRITKVWKYRASALHVRGRTESLRDACSNECMIGSMYE